MPSGFFSIFSDLEFILLKGKEGEKGLIAETQYGKIVTDKDGALLCPVCKSRLRSIRVRQGAEVHGISLMCHRCKTQFELDITAQASASESPRH